MVRGGTQNDSLSGGAGNDTLQGNEHNDTLYGDAGNDSLDGGTGSDYLTGGDGADVYLFGRGSGSDSISNYDAEALGVNADTIQLGSGIATTDVTLTRTGDNLLLNINGTDDWLTVQNYFNTDGTTSYTVENLRFADTTVWNVATVKAKVLTTTSGDDRVYGYAGNETISGGDGDDSLSGGGGVDVIDGGTGVDTINGDDGADTLRGGTGNDSINGGAGDDTLQGNEQNDSLSGGAGNDTLQGNEHNDTLYGDAGNDSLDGGTGSDYLTGGDGADVYLFGRGSGSDSISNYDAEALGVNADTIQLGSGIATTDVTLTRTGDNLLLNINGTDDWLTVQNYFNTDGTTSYTVENLRFADTTVWNVATVKAKVLTTTSGDDRVYGYAGNETISGGDGDDSLSGGGGVDVIDGGTGVDTINGDDGADTLRGGTGNDSINGGAGDDTLQGNEQNDSLSGGAGNDTLQGNEHNDTLYGDAGNDSLDGGTGSDYLTGGDGADVYLFGRGSGSDSISNYDAEALGVNADTIQLGSGIATTDVTLTRTGDNLLLNINGTDDWLTVQNYFNTDGTTSYTVENLRFADTTNWSYSTVKGKISTAGSPAGVTLSGTSGNDTLIGGAGNDNLSGAAGNDTLDGGAGNDTLDGGTGNDTYLFGRGSGKDTISDYETYDGQARCRAVGCGGAADRCDGVARGR